jgi:hypothetical protein
MALSKFDYDWEKKLKTGLALCLKKSIRKAAAESGIERKTLSKYLHKYNIQERQDLQYVKPEPEGRKEYLNAESMRILRAACLSMDAVGYPSTPESIKEFVVKLRARERNISEDEVKPPCYNTMERIKEELNIPERSARNTASEADDIRKTKATVKYLGDYFDKLKWILAEYQIKEKNM